MIIKRQKVYSSKGAQILFRLKKAANQAGVAIDNAGLKAGDSVRQILTGKAPINPTFSFRPKSKIKLGRETITKTKDLKQSTNAIVNDPGGTIGKVVNETIVQPAKHAPIGTLVSQVSPVPGTGIAYAVKGAPIEAKVWDKLGVGKVTKPIRKKMDQYVTNDTMIGAGRGVVNGLKSVMAT